ncbi:MAG: hypothetical protein DRJ52_09305, partial [Thermoprotei archaeon]
RKRKIPEKDFRQLMGVLIAYILDVGGKTKGGRLTVSYARLRRWAEKRGLEGMLKRGLTWRSRFKELFKEAIIDEIDFRSSILLDREKALKKAQELLPEFPEAKELLLSEIAVKR